MDTQLCNGFQTAHMFYFNQSFATLWQVNQAGIFLGKRYEAYKLSLKNQWSNDKFVIVQ